MTSRLKFRNLDIEPSAPVLEWPDEAVLAALERGSISDYRRIATEIRRQPWGDVARRVERVLGYSQPYGAAPLFERIIGSARSQAEQDERIEVALRLRAAITGAGLTQAEFAARTGTSASRLSTYLTGAVVPAATFLVRAECFARTLESSGQVEPA